MVHLDTKTVRNYHEEGIRDEKNVNRYKLANKGAGTQCLQVELDDHSRYASVSVKSDETAESGTKHLI